MILIKNGFVKTMSSVGDIECGEVLIENDKIVAVGKNIKCPNDAQIIDATGYIVSPGFVEGHSHIGMWEEGVGEEGSDGNESVDPITPHLRAIDAINPMCVAFKEAVMGGVTSAVTGPGSSNVIGGSAVAIKLYGDRVDDMIIKNPAAMKIAFGENPKGSFGSKDKAPKTRMGVAALLRETLYNAKQYMEDKEYAVLHNEKAPKYDIKLEALIPVLKKEIPLKAHAHRADDIFTALRIAKEFDVDITLDHCTEGHLIAKHLAKEGKCALVGPTLSSKSKIELQNMTFTTPKILVDNGVKIAITTDSSVIPLEYLSLCAGLAVKYGLDEEEAWKAITINPAEITGISQRVGSLEVGKDADVAIFKGNPLFDVNYETMYTIINGQIVYNANK